MNKTAIPSYRIVVSISALFVLYCTVRALQTGVIIKRSTRYHRNDHPGIFYLTLVVGIFGFVLLALAAYYNVEPKHIKITEQGAPSKP